MKGLVPIEPTNGGIARGGCAERIGEGVTGHLPLEWVAPHEVGAGESLFPADADGSESENETIVLVSDGEFPGVRVKTEALPIRVKIAVSNTKAAHDVWITIDLPSTHRIEIIKGDIDIATAKCLLGTPEQSLCFEGLNSPILAAQGGHAGANSRLRL